MVARWHRDRFRRYWAKISQRRGPGRPRVDSEIRQLIRVMAQDRWGAPRIHAELTKLGFTVVAFPIGYVASHVILALGFYGLLTPVGLLFRVLGRDPLHPKFESDAATYWVPRRPREAKTHYFRQF
jgi:hypothetical protein